MSSKPNPSSQQLYIDRVHAAELVDCDVQLIDKLIRKRELSAFRFGRKVLLSRSELLAYIESNRVEV